MDRINKLRYFSRKLIRELGLLDLDKGHETPPHWHALIEIAKKPGITVSELGEQLLLSISATSRIVSSLISDKLVTFKDGVDRRAKCLNLTKNGEAQIKSIDTFSNAKILGAFEHLSEKEQNQIIIAIEKYGNALEKSRLSQEGAEVSILTLSTSRPLRKQIIKMIEDIQKKEYSIAITPETNSCIMRAEEEFCYNNSANFWYAVNENGDVVGSIGLKRIDQNSAELKKFFVHDKYRGKGVAQKLLQTLLKAASRHNFTNLYLGTVDKLEAAHRFYEKYGFSRISKKQLPKSFERLSLDNVFFKGAVETIIERLKGT